MAGEASKTAGETERSRALLQTSVAAYKNYITTRHLAELRVNDGTVSRS